MRTERIKPGSYKVAHGKHTYFVYRFRSDYGDIQWMIDRDDKPCWSQADTLTQAKQYISSHGR